MTKKRTPNPQPTSGTNFSIYLWPRAKDPDHQRIYDTLHELGWRFDAVEGLWWTPEGEPEAKGRLSYEPDFSEARITPPSRMVGGQPVRPAPLLILTMKVKPGPVKAGPYEARLCPACDTWIYTAAGPFAEDDMTKTMADILHYEAEHKTDRIEEGVFGFPYMRHNEEPVDAIYEGRTAA